MHPRTIHHVFPYHVGHIADDEAGWWEAQIGVWPVAAALLGDRATATQVHVIGDRAVADRRLTVHRGTHAGPGTVPFGFDLSLPLLRTLRRLGPDDVVFLHGSDSPGGALAAEASRPAAVVAVYHGGATGGRDRQKDLAARHVVLRAEVADSLRAAGYDPATIVELTPTIAPAFFATARVPHRTEQIVVGFVGRPTEGKGADAIAPTVRALQAPGRDVLVELVGATHLDDVTALERAVADAGAELTSHGYLPNAELAPIMAGWDVLLLPSRFEGCPRSLLEASAIGIPVVCVDGVVPAKVVDGHLVRAVARAEIPTAVAAAIETTAPLPAGPAADRPAQPHAVGAAALDQIVADLPADAPRRSFSAGATARSLASIGRRSEPVLRLLRPVVHRVRRPRDAT